MKNTSVPDIQPLSLGFSPFSIVCLFAVLWGAGVIALVPLVGSPRDYSPAAPVYPPPPFPLKHFRKYMKLSTEFLGALVYFLEGGR